MTKQTEARQKKKKKNNKKTKLWEFAEIGSWWSQKRLAYK